ncbi:MAG: carboxylesterase/lipase family protein [Acidobacteriota bacterium]|nr:carboxylesterase/lipase family protein [Acidobacteriota bacterium]
MRKFPISIAIFIGAFVLIVGGALRSSAARAGQSSSPTVAIDSGKVRGTASGGLDIFKGIPFAAPPVGNLRWRAPRPVKPWKGARDAANYGHDCMQLPFPNDAAPLRTEPSEDCLYLNVWTPRQRGAKPLPVMVWIYGGGFVNGGSSPAPYDGSHFAEKGVVLVSFNYRLGRFGFFAFPALLHERGGVGNYAIMDQIAALQWVQRNIASFGGDPREVTVFGESAGGRSVNVLVASPEAKGLFVRAIVESGGGRDNHFPAVPLNEPVENGDPSAVQRGINFARAMGVDGTDAKALAALRALPAEKVVSRINMGSMSRQADTFSGLIADGMIVQRSPAEAYETCAQNPVEVMIGANSADLGTAPGKTLEAIFAPFGAGAAAAQRAFGVGASDRPEAVARKIGMVDTMIEPARFVAARVAACGEASYVYRFSYVATPLRARLTGAPHSSEIPYVFDTIGESSWGNLGKGLTAADYKMASDANAYWVNYAKTGNPNGAGLAEWPRYSAQGDGLMDFTMNDGPKGGPDPWAARLDMVEKIQK